MPQDALALLDADHQRVEALFRDYQSPGAGREQKNNLAQIICMELTVHASLEEELFYPALRRAAGDAGLVEEAEREHQQVKELIARIGAAADPDALVLALQRSVERHVMQERLRIFPKARSSGIDLDALGARLEARRNDVVATLMHET